MVWQCLKWQDNSMRGMILYKTHRRSLNSKASEAKTEFDIEEIREMVAKEVKAELERRSKLSQELTRKQFNHFFRKEYEKIEGI